MKWTWVVGRFWGTELRLHASLLLLLPYAFFAFRPGDLLSALRVLALLIGIFGCVTLHEVGHTVVARVLGIEVKSITLWPLGGFASLSRRPQKPLHNLLIVAAGPIVNFLLALGFVTLAIWERSLWQSMAFPDLLYWLYRINLFSFLAGMVITNLSLSLFNLIPIFPLDGGQMARDLLKLIFGEKRADQAMLWLSLPLALGVVLVGVALSDPLMLITGLLLVFAGLSLSARALQRLTLGLLYWIDRSGYYLKKGDYDRALTLLNQAITRHPNASGLYFQRALALVHLPEIPQAAVDLEHALALDANNAMAWNLLGEILAMQGRYPEAIAAYDRVITLRPSWGVSYADRGAAWMALKQWERAQADLDYAILIDPHTLVSFILRSMLRLERGDRAGALQDAEQALQHAPAWMLVFPDMFLTEFTDRIEWVLFYYNRAVERFPGSYQAYQGRADALRLNARHEWAAADYSRAIVLSGAEVELYLGRGLSLLELGQVQAAAQDFAAAAHLAKETHLRRRAHTLLHTTQQILSVTAANTPTPAADRSVDASHSTAMP